MKTQIIMLFFLALVSTAWTQDVTMDKKAQRDLIKQQKKAAKEEAAARTAAMVDLMATHGTFVLEADILFDKYGHAMNVPSNINFIASDSISGILQVGSNYYLGSNGVGGVTVEGRIINYECLKNEKKGYYNISYSLSTSAGTYDIQMTITADGHGDATIRSNWPGSLRYTGKVVPPSRSKVYKGFSRY